MDKLSQLTHSKITFATYQLGLGPDKVAGEWINTDIKLYQILIMVYFAGPKVKCYRLFCPALPIKGGRGWQIGSNHPQLVTVLHYMPSYGYPNLAHHPFGVIFW